MSLSPQRAAQELLDRREVRRDLNAWARHCGYEPALHHKKINEVLAAAEKGEVRKVALFLPPGSAKSTYASKLFPPHFLAQRPNLGILLCSHNKDLAQNFGRTCRNLIDQNPLQLGYHLAKDSQAADEWSTDNNGYFFCAGVGGRIAGRRADLALIDDPLGSVEDAMSKDIRDKHWDWYKTDFKPRLKPNAVRILIQTRWHEDDLAGRILDKEKDWEVIHIPMIAGEADVLGRAPGELLWPEYFTPEMAREAQEDERTWNALYQGNPTPESGVFFDAEAIKDCLYTRDQLPPEAELAIYVGSDHAIDEKHESDSTVLIPVGVDSKRVMWVLPDIFWKKVNTLQCVEEMLNVARRRSPLRWFCEKAHIEKSIGPFLDERMREQGVFFHREELTAHRSKQAKAQPLAGMIASRSIRFPSFASWWDKMHQELLKFDKGTHDDTVDALGNICRGLQLLRRGDGAPKVQEPTRPLTVKWIKEQMNSARIREEVARADR